MLGRGGRCALPIIGALLAPGPSHAQASPDSLLRWGKLATLAPLCGLRDETWSFDLRRAELQAATGSKRFDDKALRSAPGSREAVAALSYADTEALEGFAETAPERTCLALSGNSDLLDADDIVRAFRAQREHQPGS